jgi:hypothetical protein
MIRLLFFTTLIGFLTFDLPAQVKDPILHAVYLIGDTGKDTIPSEALQLLAFESFDDTLSTILFLGDNVYNGGNSPNKSANASRISNLKLTNQLALFSAFLGEIYMIPGNHDWSNGKRSGLKAIANQQQLVDQWFLQNSPVANRQTGVYFDNPGFPGPISKALSENTQLILLDSQWWLQQDLFHPVKTFDGKNKRQTGKIALERLDSLLRISDSLGTLSIVAAHHPIASNGKHSHRLEPIRSLLNFTPLHLFSWLGLNRFLRQNLPQPRYQRYRRSVEAILTKHKNVIYVSGHEHAMQYLHQKNLHLIISGSGSSTRPIDRYKYPATFMDDLQAGFFKLTVHQSGTIYLHAYGVRDRGKYWSTKLFKLSD